jgi:hypothetical protein
MNTIPSRILRERALTLLAGWLEGLGGPVQFDLPIASFTPSPNLSWGSLTIASFDGYSPWEAVSTGVQFGYDIDLNLFVLFLGGYQFAFQQSDLPLSPQAAFGYVLTDQSGVTLLGSELLPAPFQFAVANSTLSARVPTFTFLDSYWHT